jgi:hypothetical protein
VGDLGAKLEPVVEGLLEPGELLRGVCVASEAGMFRGRQVAIGVTDRRLILQGMSRRFARDGEALSLPPERIAEASAEGVSGGWVTVTSAFMDRAAVTLKLRTVDGEKRKLMMMRAEGPLEKLGGGETQRRGVEALAAWFAEAER